MRCPIPSQAMLDPLQANASQGKHGKRTAVLTTTSKVCSRGAAQLGFVHTANRSEPYRPGLDSGSSLGCSFDHGVSAPQFLICKLRVTTAHTEPYVVMDDIRQGVRGMVQNLQVKAGPGIVAGDVRGTEGTEADCSSQRSAYFSRSGSLLVGREAAGSTGWYGMRQTELSLIAY